MNTDVAEQVIEQIRLCLKVELRSSTCLEYPIAIYLHDNGNVSSCPFAGVPSYAADGSDEIVWTLQSGDWDAAGDYHEALIDVGYIDDSPEYYAQMAEDIIADEIDRFVEYWEQREANQNQGDDL